MSWANAFVGIPYRANGRSVAGCDCWGLYRLAVRARLGIDLPMWDTVDADDSRRAARAIRAERGGEAWPEVEKPRDGDLVLMRGAWTTGGGQLRGSAVHVGCFVEPGLVLHVEDGLDAVLVETSHPSVRERIVSFHRHVSFP